MADITFKIEESFGSIQSGDWTIELNLVSWNSRAPKMEIRKWDEKHEKMGKGVTLTKEEAIAFLLEAPQMLRRLGVELPEIKEAESNKEITELPF